MIYFQNGLGYIPGCISQRKGTYGLIWFDKDIPVPFFETFDDCCIKILSPLKIMISNLVLIRACVCCRYGITPTVTTEVEDAITQISQIEEDAVYGIMNHR